MQSTICMKNSKAWTAPCLTGLSTSIETATDKDGNHKIAGR